MFSNAIALAVLTTGGCLIIYNKLPRRVRKFMEKHSLLTDVITLLLIYIVLGGTLTALLAASMCGLIVSALLHIANSPDDYLFLYDMKDYIKDKVAKAKITLKEYSKNYKARKEADHETSSDWASSTEAGRL